MPEIPGLIFLPFAQAFTSRHHQNNRNNAPGDPEHGEEGAQFVGPEGAEHIANEIAENHCCYGRGSRPNVSRGRVSAHSFIYENQPDFVHGDWQAPCRGESPTRPGRAKVGS